MLSLQLQPITIVLNLFLLLFCFVALFCFFNRRASVTPSRLEWHTLHLHLPHVSSHFGSSNLLGWNLRRDLPSHRPPPTLPPYPANLETTTTVCLGGKGKKCMRIPDFPAESFWLIPKTHCLHLSSLLYE